MSIMHQEIISTPALLENTIRENLAPVTALAARIRQEGLSPIHIAARGSSANAGCYFSYLSEILAGIPTHSIMPSVLTLYPGKLSFAGSAVLAITQGGRGSDIKFLVEKAKEDGALTAAICNEADSPIAQAVDTLLPMCLGLEKAMAATKTFTAEMLLGGMLAFALSGRDPAFFSRVPELFSRVAEQSDAIDALAEEFLSAGSCYVLGRGYNLAVARELCCKLQEACFVNAFPFSQADFLHGPLALVEPGSRVIYLHAADETGPSSLELLKRLEASGAVVTLFTNDPALAEGRERVFLLPQSESVLSPFAFTAAIQLFACFLAQRKGLDPDQSRNLNKYTVTM